MHHLKRERKRNWRNFCYRGHPWTEENTIVVKDIRSKGGRRRQCRTCKDIAQEAWVERNKQKENELVDRSDERYTPVEPNYS